MITVFGSKEANDFSSVEINDMLVVILAISRSESLPPATLGDKVNTVEIRMVTSDDNLCQGVIAWELN